MDGMYLLNLANVICSGRRGWMSTNQGIVGVMMLRGHITTPWKAGRSARN